MKADQTCWFRIARDIPACEERLHLRCKAKSPAIVRCVQWLDTVWIAREKQATLLVVPDGESEHSAQPMYHFGAVPHIEMQQRLGVGSRTEVDTVFLEFGAKLWIVVDLAVEYDDESTDITNHWLGSSVGKVDDRKPSMPKTAMTVVTPPRPRSIWASCAHRLSGSKEL